MKWIGGATAAVLVLLASAVVGGQTLEAQDAGPDAWLATEDVLGADDAVTTPDAPAMDSVAVVQPLPSPSPAVAEETPFTIKRILQIEGTIS